MNSISNRKFGVGWADLEGSSYLLVRVLAWSRVFKLNWPCASYLGPGGWLW